MLYPIIRRKRRPLIEVAPAKPAPVVPLPKPVEETKQTEQQPQPLAAPTAETKPKDDATNY
jgi:hypothetical protein